MIPFAELDKNASSRDGSIGKKVSFLNRPRQRMVGAMSKAKIPADAARALGLTVLGDQAVVTLSEKTSADEWTVETETEEAEPMESPMASPMMAGSPIPGSANPVLGQLAPVGPGA